MSEIHPAAPLLRTAFADVETSASDHPMSPQLIASSKVPQAKWGAAMKRLARLESFLDAGSDAGLTETTSDFAAGLRRLPLLAVQLLDTTGRTRILGSSLALRIDTWIHTDETDAHPPSADTVAVGRLLPLNAEHWTFLVFATLPDSNTDVFEDALADMKAPSLSPDFWMLCAAHSREVLLTALQQLASARSSLLSEEDRTRLMGVRYGLDTRLLLERGFFNDSGEFKQERFPIRDIRMLLAEDDGTGIREAITTARRFREFVLGRKPSPEESAELDSLWPLDDLFAHWHARADGTLTCSLAWSYRQEPAEVLTIDEEHPVWQAIGDNASVGAAARWAERHGNTAVTEAVATYATECRWIATWGGAEELEAAASVEPSAVYDELRSAFIALFDKEVGNVLVRVNGRWKGASQTLARALELAPDQMTVARLPRSWKGLKALDVLGPSQRKALAVEVARIAYSWR